MSATYDVIQTYTANGSQNTINFSSIPSTYTDLILISSGSSAGYIEIRVGNGTVDTGNNYSRTYMYGDTTNVPTFRNVSTDRLYNTFGTTGVVGVSILNFMNYSNTNIQKSGVFRGDAAGTYLFSTATGVLWQSTSSINIIQIVGGGGANFSNGTTHTLYGIKAE